MEGKTLIEKVGGRKAVATYFGFLVSMAVTIANHTLEVLRAHPIQMEELLALLSPLMAYVLGQGVADAGSQGQATEVKRAVKIGGEVGGAVIESFQRRQKGVEAKKENQ